MPVYKGEEAYTPEAIRDNLTKAATSFVANIMDIFEPMVDAYAANVTNDEDPRPAEEACVRVCVCVRVTVCVCVCVCV